MVDTATQTDPITVLDSAVQSNTTNKNSKTEALQKQKGQTNTTNRSQTKTPIEEKKKVGLKKATMEMVKKKRFEKQQQQREKKARSLHSPPTKDQTKLKYSQGTQRPITSNRERKRSDDANQQHNRFGFLSDSSDDMELGEAPNRPRTNSNRSRSSEHTRASSSNNRSKSSITYP